MKSKDGWEAYIDKETEAIISFSKINNQIFGNHVFFLALDINSKDKKKDEMLNRKSKNK